jgi:hypothetical protein
MPDDKEPEIYRPSELQPEEPPKLKPIERVLYAIGIEADPPSSSYGMTHGPVHSLTQMLEVVPIKDSVLFRFNKDGTSEVLYKWDADERHWKHV